MKAILTLFFIATFSVLTTAQSKSTHYRSSIRGITASGGLLNSTHSSATTVNPWTEGIQQQSSNYRHRGIGSAVEQSDTSTNSIHVITPFVFSAYPNPFENTIHIRSAYKIRSASLQTTTGKQVPIALENNTISTETLSSGVYLLEVRSGEQIGYLRLIKL